MTSTSSNGFCGLDASSKICRQQLLISINGYWLLMTLSMSDNRAHGMMQERIFKSMGKFVLGDSSLHYCVTFVSIAEFFFS